MGNDFIRDIVIYCEHENANTLFFYIITKDVHVFDIILTKVKSAFLWDPYSMQERGESPLKSGGRTKRSQPRVMIVTPKPYTSVCLLWTFCYIHFVSFVRSTFRFLYLFVSLFVYNWKRSLFSIFAGLRQGNQFKFSTRTVSCYPQSLGCISTNDVFNRHCFAPLHYDFSGGRGGGEDNFIFRVILEIMEMWCSIINNIVIA